MKHGSCIHLDGKRSRPYSILSQPTFYGLPMTFLEFLGLVVFSETIRARAMKLGSRIHLEE